jgi:hypothetical protein
MYALSFSMTDPEVEAVLPEVSAARAGLGEASDAPASPIPRIPSRLRRVAFMGRKARLRM